jgi:hypothetical protein
MFSADVMRSPHLLASYDRIVIATGAKYRFGLGDLPGMLLDLGAGRWPGFKQVFSMSAFREWLYYRARKGTGEAFRRLAGPDQKVVVIGDAIAAGKSRTAIASAFEAALLVG